MTATAITAAARVRLHPLRMRPDAGDQWCVGRVETGDFVVLPAVGVEALRLLDRGTTLDEVAVRLRETSGRDIDVAGFVRKLAALGYVAAVDGVPLEATAEVRPSLPWLRPHHVRWTLSPVTAAVVLALGLCGIGVLGARPDLLPTYRDLLWSARGSVVLVGTAAIGWSLLLLHELAHLATARAAGVPGRISFGTRLQFLVVQTDVSGIWAEPRRTRLTVYLAGMALELAVFGLAVLGRLVTGAESPAGVVLGAVALLALLPLPWQCMLFMRTDLYFVLQDLTGCHNLYADGGAYVRHRARTAWRALRRSAGAPPPDPSAALPPAERRTVRGYALVLVVGSLLSLLVAALVTVPTAATLLGRALRVLATPAAPTDARLDGALTLLLSGGVWALWCRGWWRRHGPRLVRWVRRPLGSSTGRG